MILHKKKEHNDLVPVCHKFRRGECDFPEIRCWYKHELDVEEPQNKTPWGFQMEKSQTKPPETELEEIKKMVNRTME